ncbi:MAG TPA: isochorismatase family protein [Candidatus Sulfomarinibacteraceae bacterium]|nr:isochorismatase family protein [Candidatus Sulfomarinibacteraceae bacterium]
MPHLLDRSAAVLLVIDVQERINAVMTDQGHLPRLEVLVEACRALGVPVVASEQYPKGLGATVEPLAGLLGNTPAAKDTFSCGRDPGLRAAVEATGRSQVICTGIETHVCVLQTALDLLDAGYRVHVPHDAVNSRRPADKHWALERLQASGAQITTTESALFELVERCDTPDFKTVATLVKKLPVP